MYKQVETDSESESESEMGGSNKPVATLADEYGGRVQIVIDDHCFVLELKQEDGSYKMIKWWFQEAVDVLKTLPSVEAIEADRMASYPMDLLQKA